MRLAALVFLAFAGAALATPSRLLVAQGSWVALDRGTACEAIARPLAPARKQDAAPYVAVAFDRSGVRHGQLFAQLRRPSRPGSTVILTVGDQPFLLASRGTSAWSRGGAQDSALLTAMRAHGGMRIEARDPAGRRLTDRYLLDGAPTAIDAAAAACSVPR